MRTKKTMMAAAAVLGVTAIGAQLGVAAAATSATKKKHAVKHQTNTSGSTSVSGSKAGKGAETPMTGDTKTQAEVAALAKYPGGKVWRSSIEDPGDSSGAAYEVHVTKSDGSEVEVLEDKSFNVIATQASRQGPDGHGDHGHGGPANEAALTGDAKTQAEQAAQAKYPDAKTTRSSAEDGSDASGAAYEVHMTKSDGSEIEVLEDKSFNVIATNASQHGPHGDGQNSDGQNG